MKTSESYSELGHELYSIQQFVDQDIKSFLNHGILCMENVHLTQEWSIFSSHPRVGSIAEHRGKIVFNELNMT